MNDALEGIQSSLLAVRAAWAPEAKSAAIPTSDLKGSHLIAVHRELATLRRRVESLQAEIAAEIARESRRELGADSLAKQQGFRNPGALIAATTGTTTGEAMRLVKVGEATTPRVTLTGAIGPARHPHLARCLRSGRIGTAAASAIIAMLDRAALRANHDAIDRVESTLAEQAAGLSLDQLAKVLARAEAHLDPDGLRPRERDARSERRLHIFERDGMVQLNGVFDPESGAAIKIAIEALVTADFRAALDHPQRRNDVDADLRSVPQRQADALSLMAGHVLGCEHNDLPLGGATVVVRMNLADLESGDGHATIDGLARPISIAAARRMAASAAIIPCVLDSAGVILDWGREKRLFTRPQRLALVERDGGCAGCGLPPGMTRAHHLNWWRRDRGRTDLEQGVLLCESCHHRIHDNGWEIRIEGTGTRARVWFIPPAHVDAARTPQPGGRARFDYLAA